MVARLAWTVIAVAYLTTALSCVYRSVDTVPASVTSDVCITDASMLL